MSAANLRVEPMRWLFAWLCPAPLEIRHRSTGEVLHLPSHRTLRRARLAGVDLAGADLAETDLRGASLDRADLSGACLFGAALVKASLVEANLRGADLRCANLDGADLTGATYDFRTQWPSYFDPIGRGARLVD